MPENSVIKRKTFKVLIGGDGGVGKTTMMKRYVNGVYQLGMKITLGIEFHTKADGIAEEKEYDLMLWDLSGQEHFRFLLDLFLKGADGALLLFDLSRYITLASLEEWVNLIRLKDPNLPIVLIGSKQDLDSEFDDKRIKIILKKYNLSHYIKTSAVSGEGINEAFQLLLKEIIKFRSIYEKKSPWKKDQ